MNFEIAVKRQDKYKVGNRISLPAPLCPDCQMKHLELSTSDEFENVGKDIWYCRECGASFEAELKVKDVNPDGCMADYNKDGNGDI